MSLLRNGWVRVGYALYFSLSILIAALGIESNHPELKHSINLVVMGIVLSVFHLACFVPILVYRKKKGYLPLILLCGTLIFLSTLAGSLFVHSDLTRTAFHHGACMIIVVIFNRDLLYGAEPSRSRIIGLLIICCVILFGAFIWVILIGYSGVVLGIQRAKTWMFFNFYSMGLIMLSVDPLLFLRSLLYAHVSIGSECIQVNGKDYSQLLAPGDRQLLALFAGQKGYNVNCSLILNDLSQEDLSSLCKTCISENHKATQCSHYKRIYNQILKIRKFLESLNIGTVVAPENKMHITTQGWTVKLFQDVRLSIDKE